MTSATRKSYSYIYSENPFIDDPLPKAFYHPSQFRQLSESEKHLALSPLRTLNHEPEIPEKRFLAESHTIKPLACAQTYIPKSPKSDNFDESWPNSERPSSSSLNTSEERTSQEQMPYASVRRHVLPAFTSSPLTMQAGQKTLEPPAKAAATVIPPGRQNQSQAAARSSDAERMGSKVDENGSTLQRYVERFRHGAPLSREERLRQESQKQEFWWLDVNAPTPNSTSTPKEAETRGQEGRMLTAENLQKMDKLDALTVQLQEKAERLLSSTNSISSSEPIVSTDGLGSTGSDVTGSSFTEPVVRPAYVLRGTDPYSSLDRAPPQGKVKAGKEDDILFKWRLQRKLERAREAHYVPADLHGPKSADEIEVQNRLRAYREKLLQHRSVVQTQLQEARTEKLTTQIQQMMDAGVQTSPGRSDNVWPTVLQSQPQAKLDRAAQVDDRSSFLFSRPSEPLSAVGPVLSADRHYPEKLYEKVSKSDKESLCLHTSYTNDECRPALSDSDSSQKCSSALRNPSLSQPQARTVSKTDPFTRQPREVHKVPEPDDPAKGQGRVQYRQFLEAEKPDDRSDGERQPGQKHSEDSVSEDDAQCKRAVSTSAGSSRPPKDVKTESRPLTDEGDNHKQSLSHRPHQRLQDKRERYTHSGSLLGASGDAPRISQQSVNTQAASRIQHRKKIEDESYDFDKNSHHSRNHSREKVTENRLRDGGDSSVEGRNSRNVSPASLNTNQNNSRRLQEIEKSCFLAADFQPEIRRGPGERERQSPSNVGVRVQGKEKSNSKLAENSRGKESQNARVLPPPNYSSSPARGDVSSAIGQVVHNHLFDVSGSVTSSVESLPSFQHGLQSPAVSQRLRPASADGAAAVGDESEFESDGEFADDPLLAMLRHQREQYELQLRQLDALLADRRLCQRNPQ